MLIQNSKTLKYTSPKKKNYPSFSELFSFLQQEDLIKYKIKHKFISYNKEFPKFASQQNYLNFQLKNLISPLSEKEKIYKQRIISKLNELPKLIKFYNQKAKNYQTTLQKQLSTLEPKVQTLLKSNFFSFKCSKCQKPCLISKSKALKSLKDNDFIFLPKLKCPLHLFSSKLSSKLTNLFAFSIEGFLTLLFISTILGLLVLLILSIIFPSDGNGDIIWFPFPIPFPTHLNLQGGILC